MARKDFRWYGGRVCAVGVDNVPGDGILIGTLVVVVLQLMGWLLVREPVRVALRGL